MKILMRKLFIVLCGFALSGCSDLELRKANRVYCTKAKIQKVVLSEKQLEVGIKKAASWVNDQYKNEQLVLVTVLKGGALFSGRLIPLLEMDLITEYMKVSSYRGFESTDLKVELDLTIDIKNKNILIVEDIIDTGKTLKALVELLNKRGAKTIRIITLLNKKEARKVDIEADYSCFNVADEFIVGFGIDYNQMLRNLPNICTIEVIK